jgi:hypothetical protein
LPIIFASKLCRRRETLVGSCNFMILPLVFEIFESVTGFYEYTQALCQPPREELGQAPTLTTLRRRRLTSQSPIHHIQHWDLNQKFDQHSSQ